MIEQLEFVRKARTLQAATFALAYPYPVLVYKGGNIGKEAGSEFKTRLITERSGKAGIPLSVAESVLVKANSVFPLVKQQNTTYPDRISLGRTKTNDVVLPFPRVSKFHAYIIWNEERTEFRIADVGTTNGTSVDQVRLPTREPTLMRDRCEVCLGPYAFRYFMPQTFYEYLVSNVA